MAVKSARKLVSVNPPSVIVGTRHQTIVNASPYVSGVNPVELRIMSPEYRLSLANDNAIIDAAILLGTGENGIGTIPADDVDRWAELARDHVAYVHKFANSNANRGLFAYGDFVEKTNTERAEYVNAGERSIQYLPLVRLVWVSVKNGTVIVDESLTITASGHTFFASINIRRDTPLYNGVVGTLPATALSGKEYPFPVRGRGVTAILHSAGVTGIVRRVIADMLDRVSLFVADSTGNYAQRVTNQPITNVPATVPANNVPFDAVALATTLRNAGITDQSVIAAAIVNAMGNANNTSTYVPVAPQLPPAFNPATLYSHQPTNTLTVPSVTDATVPVATTAKYAVGAIVPVADYDTLTEQGYVIVAAMRDNRPVAVVSAIPADQIPVVKESVARGKGTAKKAITVDGTRYDIPITADKAMIANITAAITAANQPSKKNAATNRLIAEFLPYASTWTNKAGENAADRANRAAIAVASIKN